jgi:hypothetical protein
MTVEAKAPSARHSYSRQPTSTAGPSYFTNGICNSAGAPPCPILGAPVYRHADRR